MLSVIAHVTIIGLATVVTARGNPGPRVREKPIVVSVTPPPPPKRVDDQPPPPHTREVTILPDAPHVTITTVVAPTIIPPTLPPIDLTHGIAADSIVVGATSSTDRGAYASRRLDLSDGNDGDTWRGADLITHIVTSAKPRYPESLRSAGIDGRVVVRFVIDTVGKIEPASVQVVSSTHELFTNAVKNALGGFRFRPAESGGHRVTSLAEMPFEFSITR